MAKAYNSRKIKKMMIEYEQGYPIKLNKVFYRNHTQIRKSGIAFTHTNEELIEYAKCYNDPIYFIETYCKVMTCDGIQNIKLRDYQKEIIKQIHEQRFNIGLTSRQVGITLILSLYSLYELTFSVNKLIYFVGVKNMMLKEIHDKVMTSYYHLPFFLKVGVHNNSLKRIDVENGSSITFSNSNTFKTPYNVIDLKKYSISVYLHDFAFYSTNDKNRIFISELINLLGFDKSKVIITSCKNGYEKFYEVYRNAELGGNIYRPFKVDWWQVPGRDEEWKQKEIKNLGSVEEFNRNYEMNFKDLDR